jgi:hypothetical protein
LLAEELDSLEDALPAEDELVDVSELVVGVLELVDDSPPPEVPDDPLAADSVVELVGDAACPPAAFFAAALLAAARLAAELFSAALFPAEAVTVDVLAVAVAFFVESAGSCPEASWTYTARNAAANKAAASPAMPRRMRCTRRRIAERRLLASARASSCSWGSFGRCSAEGVWRGSMVAPIGCRIACRRSLRGACPSSLQ